MFLEKAKGEDKGSQLLDDRMGFYSQKKSLDEGSQKRIVTDDLF